MAEELLRVEKQGSNRYVVFYEGREWGLLASPIQDRFVFRHDSFCDDRIEVSFSMVPIYLEPEPKPKKRKYSTAIGLRKPK